MATQLDLQEQEQLDALKAFWKQYGSLITWLLILLLGAYAAWTGWHWYQRNQAQQAAAMYDELDRSAQAGDSERVGRVFADLRDKYPKTAFAAQGGLLSAQVQADQGHLDAAREALTWVADEAGDPALQTVGRIRLAGLLLELKDYAGALQRLDEATAPGFEALVADRRGDVLMAQGKTDEAKAAWQAAYKAMPPEQEYRRLIESKLTAIGAPPSEDKP
jgi:predicted negative regulator of RcsB-dependent stress response